MNDTTSLQRNQIKHDLEALLARLHFHAADGGSARQRQSRVRVVALERSANSGCRLQAAILQPGADAALLEGWRLCLIWRHAGNVHREVRYTNHRGEAEFDPVPPEAECWLQLRTADYDEILEALAATIAEAVRVVADPGCPGLVVHVLDSHSMEGKVNQQDVFDTALQFQRAGEAGALSGEYPVLRLGNILHLPFGPLDAQGRARFGFLPSGEYVAEVRPAFPQRGAARLPDRLAAAEEEYSLSATSADDDDEIGWSGAAAEGEELALPPVGAEEDETLSLAGASATEEEPLFLAAADAVGFESVIVQLSTRPVQVVLEENEQRKAELTFVTEVAAEARKSLEFKLGQGGGRLNWKPVGSGSRWRSSGHVLNMGGRRARSIIHRLRIEEV